MAAKQEDTIEKAEGAVTVSIWARAPSAGVALHQANYLIMSKIPEGSRNYHLSCLFYIDTTKNSNTR